jgi:hypothetical protein
MQSSETVGPNEFEKVLEVERRRIEKHRAHRQVAPDSPYFGLCLSGGGIRSASFALGVMQGLHANGLLKKFDYLSTVSGGGYIGSSFTWFSHVLAQSGLAGQFPFGTKGLGARSTGNETPLNYLRQHGCYLSPSSSLNTTSLVANFVRNSLLSFSVYFSLIVALFCLLNELSAFRPLPVLEHTVFSDLNGSFLVSAGMIILFVIITIGYGLGSFFLTSMSCRDYDLRVVVQKLLGIIFLWAVLVAALGTLPLVQMLLKIWTVNAGQAGGLMSILGAVGSIYGYRKQQSAAPQTKGKSSFFSLTFPAFVLAYGLILVAYVLAQLLTLTLAEVALYLLLPSIFLGVLVNTNTFGPGRYYRDRLMEAFMPGKETVKDSRWRPASDADRTKLSEMCSENEFGPYHLINCNLILVDSTDDKFRGRGGDSFTLSPLYCGSYATGWFDTRVFLKNQMTLATAMSISGASLSPDAGNNGEGATRNRTVSFLLSILNLRLGFYAANPAMTGIKKWAIKLTRPNFYYPGLVQGLLGGNLDEKASFLSLSDGGHFEDSGLYELARRRLDVIMVCEAGADPDYTLSDLANAIERVRVDFGYHIDFSGELGIAELLPGSACSMVGNEDIKLAKRGYAIGRIDYDEHHSGKIIYLQSVLTRNMPADIFSYRKLHESFPNEPTSDQFFSETQFEAYRELGYQLCKDMAKGNMDENGSTLWI